MFTFLATGYLVSDAKAVVPLSGSSPFYSFKISVKKRGAREKDPSRVYIDCVMDKSKKSLAEIMKKGKQVSVSGVMYDITTYFSEVKQEQLVQPKARIHHVQLLSFSTKNPEEDQENPEEDVDAQV